MIDLDKVKATPLLVILLFLIALFVPGYTFLFLFEKNLFFSLDTFKLSILAVSIAIPFIVTNWLILLVTYNNFGEFDKVKTPEEAVVGIYRDAILTSIFSIVVLYFIMFIGFCFELSSRQLVWAAILLYLFFGFLEGGERLILDLRGKSKTQ